MRFLSVFLPTLPTDRIIRRMRAQDRGGSAEKSRKGSTSGKAPEPPRATLAKINGAQKLAAIDAEGRRLGLRSGMNLADARAMHPALICAEADPEGEAQTLAHIVDWCRRFTPLAALDAPDGVMLDVSGAAHLFGGEASLLAEIEESLRRQGFCAQGGLASTPEAAFALARYGAADFAARILPPALDAVELERRLGGLPLAALRLEPETLSALAEAGLRRIRDVTMRPRAPIAARCGLALYARLDGLLGRVKTPISPRFEAPAFMTERRFLDGLCRREDVEASIAGLAQDLCALLTRHGEGARRLEASLFRVDGEVMHFTVGTMRPLRDPALIARLFHERFEALSLAQDGEAFDAGFGFDVIRLAALALERKDPEQTGWSGQDRAEDRAQDHVEDLAELIDRLGARLGLRRVTRLAFNGTHAPEFAVIAVPAARYDYHHVKSEWPRFAASPAGGQAHEEAKGASPMPARPIRLLERPEPIEAVAAVPDGPPLRFRWRRVLHEVAAFEGPERIAPEWWRGTTALTRDYFRAEDCEGRRFWLFREGLFDRETTRPRWFMHGFFA